MAQLYHMDAKLLVQKFAIIFCDHSVSFFPQKADIIKFPKLFSYWNLDHKLQNYSLICIKDFAYILLIAWFINSDNIANWFQKLELVFYFILTI